MNINKCINQCIQDLKTFKNDDLLILQKWCNARSVELLAQTLMTRQIMYVKARMEPSKIWGLYKDALLEKYSTDTSFKGTITELDPAFIKADPSRNKKWVPWIVNSYIQGGIKRFEDLSRTREALKEYDYLLQKGLIIDTWFKDINRFCGIAGCYVGKKNKYKIGLEQFLEDYSEDLEKLKEDKEIQVSEKEVEKVYEDDELLLVVPMSKEAACKYGKGTKWCTAATRGDNLFRYYDKTGKLYILIPKNPTRPKEKYQLHFTEEQFMNENDEPVDIDELVERFPVLRQVLKNELLGFYIKFSYYHNVNYWENYEKIKQLLDIGADPNFKVCVLDYDDDCIDTPIIMLTNGDDISELLLHYGADINATNKAGINFLLQGGSAEFVKRHSGNINFKTKYGNTALTKAVIDEDIPRIQELLRAGADINIPTQEGKTALQWAMLHFPGGTEEDIKHYDRMIQVLLDAGADPHYKDPSGFTAVDYSKSRGLSYFNV